jgi:hypothetical protein
MSPLPEEDAFFSLCTIIEDLLPSDYYTHDLLGARIDQLVFATLMTQHLPTLTAWLTSMQCLMSLFSLQWFMCLFAKDLPLSLTLRVWDVMFVYGDPALFAFALALLQVAEPLLLACSGLEELYDCLKTLGRGLVQRDAEIAHRLVLHSLDALMRTSLVEDVEAERQYQRRYHAASIVVRMRRPPEPEPEPEPAGSLMAGSLINEPEPEPEPKPRMEATPRPEAAAAPSEAPIMAPVAAPVMAPVAACRTAPDAAVSCAAASESGDEAGPNAAPSATGVRSSASQGSLPS